MYNEEWLDNLSAVVLGTSDVTRLEDDIIKLLEAKYDSIRHKILEEALKDQMGMLRLRKQDFACMRTDDSWRSASLSR